MNRLISLLSVLAVCFIVVVPVPTAAQEPEFDEGEVADEETTAAVESFIDNLVTAFNTKDESIFDYFDHNYETFGATTYDEAIAYFRGAARITVYEKQDVRTHESDHVSIELTYSGWNGAAQVRTVRWYLQPSTGTPFVAVSFAAAQLRVPERFDRTGEANLELGLADMLISETEFSSIDLLVLHVSTEEDVPITAGLYKGLPGTDAEIVQQALLEYDYTQVNYLGPKYLEPQSSVVYAFILEPGEEYYLQAYGFLGDTVYSDVYVLEGDQFFATLTLADD